MSAATYDGPQGGGSDPRLSDSSATQQLSIKVEVADTGSELGRLQRPSASTAASHSDEEEEEDQQEQAHTADNEADDEDLEFEALRAAFTARAIEEACRTKIRSLLPSYGNMRRQCVQGSGRMLLPPPGALPGLNCADSGAGDSAATVGHRSAHGFGDGTAAITSPSRSSNGGGVTSVGGDSAPPPGDVPSSDDSHCDAVALPSFLRPVSATTSSAATHSATYFHDAATAAAAAYAAAAAAALPTTRGLTDPLMSWLSPASVFAGLVHAAAATRGGGDDSKATASAATATASALHRCGECGAAFTRSSTLKRHAKLHRGIKDRPFKCSECDASFAYNNHLKTHMRTHTGERPYACEACGARFARTDGLKIHRRKHTGERPYVCDCCGARFAVAHHLKEHMRTHTAVAVGASASAPSSSAAVAATVFSSPFSSSSSSSSHSSHSTSSTAGAAAGDDATAGAADEACTAGDPAFMCRECGDELPSLAQLRHHMEAHGRSQKQQTPQKPLSRSLLSETATLVPAAAAASATARTAAGAHANGQPPALPPQRSRVSREEGSCEARVPLGPTLAAATSQLLPSPHQPVRSPRQPVLSPRRPVPSPRQPLPSAALRLPPPLTSPPNFGGAAATDMLQQPPANEQPSLIVAEGVGFVGPAGGDSDLAVGPVSAQPRKPFKCSLCPFSFQCRAHLATHMRIHTGERPYACSDCGAAFARPDGLKIHRRTHTGERPYACGRCDARFSMAHHLRQHARRHTGEKPFMCGECGDDFSSANRLKQHRRVHTGEKPFECPVCAARFTWSDYLRVHMRTHTGERPYACEDCGAAFARSDILKVHRRTHTGERPYPCRDCTAAFKTLGQLQSHVRTHHGTGNQQQPPSAATTGEQLRSQPLPTSSDRALTGARDLADRACSDDDDEAHDEDGSGNVAIDAEMMMLSDASSEADDALDGWD